MNERTIVALGAVLALWAGFARSDESEVKTQQDQVKLEITRLEGKCRTDAGGQVIGVVFPPCHSQASDVVVSKLRVLPTIRELRFTCPKVTDQGLEHLKELPELERLFFNCMPITDKGLQHLQSCTKLKKLCLRYCSGVTPAGLAAFKAKLPGCEVTLDQFPKW